jgi:hypothetical protein
VAAGYHAALGFDGGADGAAVAVRRITTLGKRKRARALAMVRALYRASRGDGMRWSSADVIMKRPADIEVLSFAVEQHWIEMSPGTHSVRLTAEGWRVVAEAPRYRKGASPLEIAITILEIFQTSTLSL